MGGGSKNKREEKVIPKGFIIPWAFRIFYLIKFRDKKTLKKYDEDTSRALQDLKNQAILGSILDKYYGGINLSDYTADAPTPKGCKRIKIYCPFPKGAVKESDIIDFYTTLLGNFTVRMKSSDKMECKLEHFEFSQRIYPKDSESGTSFSELQLIMNTVSKIVMSRVSEGLETMSGIEEK